MLANSRPELVIKDEKKITIFLLDIAVPNNIINTVRHIIEKVEQQWQVKAKVLPMIVSTNGVIRNSTGKGS